MKHLVVVTLLCVSCFLISSTAVAAGVGTTTVGMKNLTHSISTGRAQIQHLSSTSTTPGISKTLRRGTSGKEVRLLQDFLKLYGALATDTPTTGYFGPKTEAALTTLQRRELLDPVGVAGPKTRARIVAISKLALAESAQNTVSTSSVASALLATEVNEDGSGVGSATVFASTTRNLYAVLMLVGVQTTDQVGYIRSYNGTYVDSGVTHPSRTGLRYLHFQWSLKPGAMRSVGQYSITFYLNGKRAQTISYLIQ